MPELDFTKYARGKQYMGRQCCSHDREVDRKVTNPHTCLPWSGSQSTYQRQCQCFRKQSAVMNKWRKPAVWMEEDRSYKNKQGSTNSSSRLYVCGRKECAERRKGVEILYLNTSFSRVLDLTILVQRKYLKADLLSKQTNKQKIDK